MKGEINITNQRASLSPFQGKRTVSPLFSILLLPYCHGADRQDWLEILVRGDASEASEGGAHTPSGIRVGQHARQPRIDVVLVQSRSCFHYREPRADAPGLHSAAASRLIGCALRNILDSCALLPFSRPPSTRTESVGNPWPVS